MTNDNDALADLLLSNLLSQYDDIVGNDILDVKYPEQALEIFLDEFMLLHRLILDGHMPTAWRTHGPE